MTLIKRYLIDTPVELAEGTQTWYVDARSEQEAMEIFKRDGGKIYEQEVEVVSIGEPAISGVTDVTDPGDYPEKEAT